MVSFVLFKKLLVLNSFYYSETISGLIFVKLAMQGGQNASKMRVPGGFQRNSMHFVYTFSSS